MAGNAQTSALLKAVGIASWRDLQSFRSIAGQNFFLFAMFVAYQQAESAELFFVLLVLVVVFPLSADALQKIPAERRLSWPVSSWTWFVVQVGSVAFNPIAWVALLLLLRTGWHSSGQVAASAAVLQGLVYIAKRWSRASSSPWIRWIPAPPGAMGAIMRLHWRGMLMTLDPYLALALLACTELYRTSGRPLDAAAPRIMALLVSLAMSTETQVLFGIDGSGAERYRHWPLRGWQILLAKDLAFLALLSVLVLPLDFFSGLASGVAALAIGHYRSVLKTAPQARWRFTAGALFPDGVIQTIALFAVGLEVRSMPLPLTCVCLFSWFASLLFYGWQWDRQRGEI